MPLRVKCPTGHTLIVPDDRAGRTLKCPRCDQSVVVPGGESDAASQALLSVLAEGIPAASLAAGSLKVAPIPAQLLHAPRRAAESPVASKPPRQPRIESPAALASVALAPIKPKSQVIAPTAPPTTPPVVEPPRVEAKQAAADAPPRPAEPADLPHVPEPPASDPVVERALPPLAEPVVETPIEPATSTETPAAPESVTESVANTVAEPTSPVALEMLPSYADSIAPRPPPPIAAQKSHEPDVAPPLMDEAPAPPFVPQPALSVPTSLAADAARTLAVYQLAAALAVAALFSIVPAVWDVVEFLRTADSTFVARWALALFFLGVVQLAYAVYLFQLPDWTTVWVVTLLSLVLAAVYAAVLGLVLLSPPDGFLIGHDGLQLADKLAGGKAALWCLCMISLSTILAFFAGRLGTGWHRAEMMLRASAA